MHERLWLRRLRDVELEAGAHRTIFNAEIYEYHEAMVTKHPELYQPQTLASNSEVRRDQRDRLHSRLAQPGRGEAQSRRIV